MQELLFIVSFIGSFSLGYMILRTALPEKQSASLQEKLGYSYALGIIMFIPSFIVASSISAKSFFLIFIITFIIFFIGALVKRKMDNSEDEIELIKEEKSEVIPKKILKKEREEKNWRNKNFPKKENIIKEEKNIKKEAEKKKKTFSSGELKVIGGDKQIFKEKEPSVIDKLREKTTESNKEISENEKKKTLEKLRGFAKDIDKKKNLEKNKKDFEEDEELEEIKEIDEMI
jgi:uncharacterized membrane protein YgaE (UPF0421/DUF939 family)